MKQGFTLLELIVVVIILGILASVAIPQFINTVERARVGEALSILPVINGAQLRFATANPGFNTTVGTADLDVVIPAPRSFNAPILFAVPVGGANQVTVSMQRSVSAGRFGMYAVSACEQGQIICSGGNAGDCNVLGLALSACP